MEKRAVIEEGVTPSEVTHPTEEERLQKQGKMHPKEVRIEELDENHPIRRLIITAEAKLKTGK